MFKCLVYLLFPVVALSQNPSAEVRSWSILQHALKDKNPDTRKEAVVALSLGGAREPFVSQLESMLADKDVQVRLATIASLEDFRTRRAVAALRNVLQDDVPEVSFAAAKALWGMKEPSGKAALLSVLSGETKTSSGFLTRQKRDAMRMMHTPKPMFMFALTHGIGFAPVPGLGAGVASMQGLLSDPAVSGRAAAALLLGREADRQTIGALRESLVDKDWSVRAAAVHSLALRNDPGLQSSFETMLNDTREAVRLRAAAAYLRLLPASPARPPLPKQ